MSETPPTDEQVAEWLAMAARAPYEDPCVVGHGWDVMVSALAQEVQRLRAEMQKIRDDEDC